MKGILTIRTGLFACVLVLVVILAGFLRLGSLGTYPPSLNWDEVSHGYNAYSILKTGNDEWGISLPSVFRAYGDYKLPVYGYLLVPIIWLNGMNAESVRMVSALAGVGAVVFSYLLAKLLVNVQEESSDLGGNVVGLLTALLVAVAPWTIFLSRVAVEANLAAFFIISGAYFFLLGVRQMQRKEGLSWAFGPAGLMWGISLFTYNSARGFIPLLVGWLILVYWNFWGWDWRQYKRIPGLLQNIFRSEYAKRLKCTCHLAGLGIFLLFLLGMVYQMTFSQAGQARLNNIFVIDQGMINRINQARGESRLNPAVTKLIHNKVTYGTIESSRNYISFFDWSYWYKRGGDNYQFEVPGLPLLPLVNLPLLLWGLVMIRKLPVRSRMFVLGWILLAPVPASITRDNPHTLRIITMLPMMQFVSAWGAWQIGSTIYGRINKRQAWVILGILGLVYVFGLGWQVTKFWEVYTKDYSQRYSWVWQEGNKPMVKYVKGQYDNYEQIFITRKYGEPHEFVLFYWPWSPDDYHVNKDWEYRDAGTSVAWYWVHGFDKFRFVNDWEIKSQLIEETAGEGNGRLLLITSPGNVPNNWTRLDTIEDTNGNIVYEAYAFETPVEEN